MCIYIMYIFIESPYCYYYVDIESGFRVSAGLVLEWVITRIGVRCGFGFQFRVSGSSAHRLRPIRIRPVAILK